MKRNPYDLLISEKRNDSKWGVIHSGNAACVAIFETKKQAEAYRKAHAYYYSVVPVNIYPDYEWIKRYKGKNL